MTQRKVLGQVLGKVVHFAALLALKLAVLRCRVVRGRTCFIRCLHFVHNVNGRQRRRRATHDQEHHHAGKRHQTQCRADHNGSDDAGGHGAVVRVVVALRRRQFLLLQVGHKARLVKIVFEERHAVTIAHIGRCQALQQRARVQYAVWQRIEIARARPRQLAAHRPFQQLKVQLAAATRRANRLPDLHRAADRDLIRSRINVAVVHHLVGERAVAVQHEDVVRFAARTLDRAANQRHHTTLSHRRHLVLSARVHVNGRVTLVVAATLAKVD
mmetsp:Transcript_3487/g.5674  ORF Transcript_3487/g.5674 Transcript_3487/m.5674 type:complete len:271 (+) Transcript_3487:69-881(+)